MSRKAFRPGCLILGLLFLGLAAGGGVYLRAHPYLIPLGWQVPLADRVAGWFESLKSRVPTPPAPSGETGTEAAGGFGPSTASPATPETTLANHVTLYLTNGGVVAGELLEEGPTGVTLRWEYGDVVFSRAEIERMVTGREVEGEDDVILPSAREEVWPHAEPVVFRMLKGNVVDVPLDRVDEEQLYFLQRLPQGGTIEMVVPRADLDHVMFRPLDNPRSRQIRETLEELFPEMIWHEEGLFSIRTDSILPAVQGYRRTIRQLATDLYLALAPLLQDRELTTQQYVVIFDDWGDYIEYAISDGVPGWLAPGYFSPDDKVLYMVNVMSDRFSRLLEESFLGTGRRVVNEAVDMAKTGLNERHHLALEGRGSELKQEFERAHAQLQQMYAEMTTLILRHELTHALLHNWGAQSIVLSRMAEEDRGQAASKRAYLEEPDPDKKRQLLTDLLSQASGEPLPEMQAANSWLVEGLATYMEYSPVGSPNPQRIPDIQDAHQEGRLLPLEFLNTFRMGSFPGVAHQAALSAYSQSWALVHFLMTRYREPFLAYLDRIATEQPDTEEEELAWLVEVVARPQRELEAEFADYVAAFPPYDPFWLKQKQVLLDLRANLQSR